MGYPLRRVVSPSGYPARRVVRACEEGLGYPPQTLVLAGGRRRVAPMCTLGYTCNPPSAGHGCCFCMLSVCFTGRLFRRSFPNNSVRSVIFIVKQCGSLTIVQGCPLPSDPCMYPRSSVDLLPHLISTAVAYSDFLEFLGNCFHEFGHVCYA